MHGKWNDEVATWGVAAGNSKAPAGHIGLLLGSMVYRRLLEGMASAIACKTTSLHIENCDVAVLRTFDLIIADPGSLADGASLFRSMRHQADGDRPAVIAALVRSDPTTATWYTGVVDGSIVIPQSAEAIQSQLSIMLYAHQQNLSQTRNANFQMEFAKQIFSSLTSGVSVADARSPDLPLIYVNPTFETLTGYSFEEVCGRNCRFLQSPSVEESSLKVIREALKKGTPATVVLRNVTKEGRSFWNELKLSPVKAADGTIIYFVGVQTDVSARVDAEIVLRQSDMLAASSRLADSISLTTRHQLERVTELVCLAKREDELNQVRLYLSEMQQELKRIRLDFESHS